MLILSSWMSVAGAVLAITLTILPPQEKDLAQAGDDNDAARSEGHPHALAVVGRVGGREDVGAQDGTALAARGENGQGSAAFRVCRVRVAHPGEDEGDRDEDHHGQEEPEVPRRDGRLRGQDNVADGGDDGRADDERAPQLVPVGDEGACDDGDPAGDVRRGAEPVGLDGREDAHLGDDGGDEQREGGKADVAAKVHQGWKVTCRNVLFSSVSFPGSASLNVNLLV